MQPPVEDLNELYRQHAVVLAELQNIYLALAAGAFLGLIALGSMFAAAIWSVQKVTAQQQALEGKFSLLIDVMLKQAEREIAARKRDGIED